MNIVEKMEDLLQRFVGKQVVADLGENYLIVGTLDHFSNEHVSFADADLHDHREGNSTKEIYILETVKFGVRVNRQRVDIPRRQLVAISLLSDIAS